MVGQMIFFEANGSKTGGYLSLPPSNKGPAVIVLQEWWGLVPHIKSVCDRFASAGYVALAPDMYHGKSTTSPDEAGRLMMALNIDRAAKDLAGAVQFLKNHPAVSGQKVGTVGFCMGGVLSLYAACENPEISATVVFYGVHPKVQPRLEKLQSPVLGIYAAEDKFVTPEHARSLESELNKLGKKAEIHIYEGADHAFFNDSRAAVYHELAAKDAWSKVLRFFRDNLVLAGAA